MDRHHQRSNIQLQQLLSQINKITPVNVTIENEHTIRKILYGNEKMKHARLLKADYVRISIKRQVFAKGYIPQWSEEIFKIYKVLKRRSEPLYQIKDLKGEEIKGSFYGKELQKVHFDRDKSFTIESILKNEKDLEE